MLDPVTLRYAEALFGLAQRSGALDEVRSNVEGIARQLEDPSSSWFFDARIPLEQRRAKMRELTVGVHTLMRNFIELLFDKRREQVLRGLGAAFHAKSLQDRGAAEGVVESARALDDREIFTLQTALGARLGKEVTLTNEVVPDVLGGVRVIVGSQMMDASLRGRMDGLKKRLSLAPLPSLSEG